MAANAVLTADEERELQDGLHEIAAIEKSEQSLWQGGWSKEQQQQKQRPRQGDEDEYIQHAQQRLNQILAGDHSCKCRALSSMATVTGALARATVLHPEPLSTAVCHGAADHANINASDVPPPTRAQQQQSQQRQEALSTRVQDLTRAKTQLEIKVQQCTQEAEKVQAEKMAAINDLKAAVQAAKHLRREKKALAMQLRQLMRRTGNTARNTTA